MSNRTNRQQFNFQSNMTKQDFLDRLYITREDDDEVEVTFNDTQNYVFVRLCHANTDTIRKVFDTQNPKWSDVRLLMHDVRMYGEITNSMKYPVRYPLANI